MKRAVAPRPWEDAIVPWPWEHALADRHRAVDLVRFFECDDHWRWPTRHTDWPMEDPT